MDTLCITAKKLVDSLVTLESWVGIMLFAVTGIIMTSQIFMRRVLNLPFIWAEDLTVFLFVWMTFLGAAVLYHRKTILSIDSLVTVFSQRVQRSLGIVVDILLFVSLFYLTKLSYDFFGLQKNLGHKLGGATGMPSYMMTLAVIVGMATMFISTLVSLLNHCVQSKN
jgi:TRAP-type C4-dicarboxylate transport system permease small subunit